jgi:copper(I)-binding protein
MKNLTLMLAGVAALMVAAAASAGAQETKAGDLVITQPWSRATPTGAKVAGGYLTIENKGSAPDRLVGGAGDVAGKLEIHEMAMNNGVMTMRPLDKGLTIEPMLEFEKAGKVTLSLDVQGVGAQAPMDHSGGHMKK